MNKEIECQTPLSSLVDTGKDLLVLVKTNIEKRVAKVERKRALKRDSLTWLNTTRSASVKLSKLAKYKIAYEDAPNYQSKSSVFMLSGLFKKGGK